MQEIPPSGPVSPSGEDGGEGAAPAGKGPPAGDRRGCTPARIAEESSDCDAEYAADQATYDEILQQQFLPLRRETYLHNIAVTGYEQHLQNFVNELAGFESSLSAYVQDLAGRTYTTTALNATADDLDAERAVLQASQAQVSQEFTDLQGEADDENQAEADLKSSLGDLSQGIADVLASFQCIACPSLAALEARTDALLQASDFTIKYPSAAPPDVPPVPRLPAPPAPPQAGVPPPVAPGRHHKAKVTHSPPIPSHPKLIQAGEVWPKHLPIEGGARVCVGAIEWEWPPLAPGQNVTAATPGVRGPRGYGIFTYRFKPGSQPVVSVGGGLPVSDVWVSADGSCVFFTLHRKDQTAPSGTYDIVVTDDDGTVVQLKSPDPGTSLTFHEDAELGLAGLQAGLVVGIDSLLLRAEAEARTEKEMLADAGALTLRYEDILLRMAARAAGSGADLPPWAAPIDMAKAMFTANSFYDRDSGLWDYDLCTAATDPCWPLQVDISERMQVVNKGDALSSAVAPSAGSLGTMLQILTALPLRHPFSPPLANAEVLP